nr:folylpolyglutamate synthase/dihydrofolate synthase family protein [Deinococcus maricopensis]
MNPGLERVEALLSRLEEPQRSFRVVLVGGTNGKGSTAATLAAMLEASGERVGLFTSPHLTRFGERFRVNGVERPSPEVEAALAVVRPHAEALEATFFEVVTALACLLFARAGVGTAVMEVGLGGRWDATNALSPALSVITNVALDHTEVLGDTVEAIAREKAGILRAGRPAVTGVDPGLLPLLTPTGADLWALGREAKLTSTSRGWQGWRVQLQAPQGAWTFQTPLLGEHGARNAALAALAAARLGVPVDAIERGAAGTVWPGRLERLTWGEREVLLDGAHNPDGARALRRALATLGVGRVPVVFGATADKDVAGVAGEIAAFASEVVLTRAVLSPRAAPPVTLTRWFPRVPVRVAETPAEALASLPPGLSVVCGSLYLIGEVRPLLLGEAPERMERWQ